MTEGTRRASSPRGPSTRWSAKEIVVAVVCVLMLGSGAYAVLTHLGTPDLPPVQNSRSAAGNGAPPPSPGAAQSGAGRPQPQPPGVEAAVAARIFDLWARPGTTYRTWWHGLAPRLSPQAAAELAGTDPRVLPAAHRTGEPTVLRRENGVFTRVAVSTNLGRFDLDLVRQRPSGSWRLDRIGFPEDNR